MSEGASSSEKGGVKAALEKARQRRLAVLEGQPEALTRDQRRTAAAEAKATAPVAPIPNLAYVPFDPATCKLNRVLIPERGSARAPGAAEYRMLRTRILQRARVNQWRLIGITSPGPGDGKSLTAINLSIALALEKNNNVFLLDLDMRSPKICSYLGTAPPVEISDYLAGSRAPQDVLFSIGIENLVLAGATMPTDQSSELLATDAIDALFRHIRDISSEPLVLLDLPPILATDDALVIAPKIDAFLLVVSEGSTRRDSTAEALDLLSEFTLAGLVLNRSRAVVKDYYYSG